VTSNHNRTMVWKRTQFSDKAASGQTFVVSAVPFLR
jgi:hypothetical protein